MIGKSALAVANGELQRVNLTPSMMLHALPNDSHKVIRSLCLCTSSPVRFSAAGRAGTRTRLLDLNESFLYISIFLLFVLFPKQAEQKSSLRLLKLQTVLKSLHGK